MASRKRKAEAADGSAKRARALEPQRRLVPEKDCAALERQPTQLQGREANNLCWAPVAAYLLSYYLDQRLTVAQLLQLTGSGDVAWSMDDVDEFAWSQFGLVLNVVGCFIGPGYLADFQTAVAQLSLLPDHTPLMLEQDSVVSLNPEWLNELQSTIDSGHLALLYVKRLGEAEARQHGGDPTHYLLVVGYQIEIKRRTPVHTLLIKDPAGFNGDDANEANQVLTAEFVPHDNGELVLFVCESKDRYALLECMHFTEPTRDSQDEDDCHERTKDGSQQRCS